MFDLTKEIAAAEASGHRASESSDDAASDVQSGEKSLCKRTQPPLIANNSLPLRVNFKNFKTMNTNYKKSRNLCFTLCQRTHSYRSAIVYVPPDIYVRYLRMRGRETLFVCGSDEHSVPITIKARKRVVPQDIVDKYHGIIKNSFADFGIKFDIYSRTSSQIHYKTASEFFKKLYDKGKFVGGRVNSIMMRRPSVSLRTDMVVPAPNAVQRSLR